MADEITLTIDTRELEKALQALPEKVVKQCLRRALQNAGDTMLRPMKVLAPERTDDVTPDGNSLPPGILKEDLHTEIVFKGDTGRVKVGPSQIAGHVARWQNNGWTVTTRGRRRKLKNKPGLHFLEAAFDQSVQKATDVFCETLGEEIAKNAGEGSN